MCSCLHLCYPSKDRPSRRYDIKLMIGWGIFINFLRGWSFLWQEIINVNTDGNNYISSMSTMLESYENQSFPISNSYFLKRSIRIKSSRLPPDFFGPSNNFRYEAPSSSIQVKNQQQGRSIRTPCFSFRKLGDKTRESDEGKGRKVQTARAPLSKNQGEGIFLEEARVQSINKSRVIRKLSLSYNSIEAEGRGERHLRLPRVGKMLGRDQNQQTIY